MISVTESSRPTQEYQRSMQRWLGAMGWNYFVTFNFNTYTTLESGRTTLKRFHAKLDRSLYGRNFNALPVLDRTMFIAFPEHVDSNLHYHAMLHTKSPDFVSTALKSWSSVVPSGALLGAASSIGTEKHKYHIAVRLKNGETFGGETQPDVVDVLKRISPNISDQKILNIKKDRERLQQFIEDAPRTIHETKNRIELITTELSELEGKISNGKTFEERQKAKENHVLLQQELLEQEHLYVLLDNRLKGKYADATRENAEFLT